MAIKDMNKESRAFLSIFVKQLLDIINSSKTDSYKITEIRERIVSLVRANDLHPEKVKTLDIDGMKLSSGDISVTDLQDVIKKLG